MKHVQVSDVGKVRNVNQDAVYAVSCGDVGLFAVADGMGGYTQGEKASGLIVDKLANWWNAFDATKYDKDFKRMLSSLQQVLEEANRDIFQQYNQEAVCGSTVVVLFIYHNSYGILHAGDSRVYLYEEHKIKQLTIDEVWENQAELTPEERKKNWNSCKGKLLNAVGIRKDLQCRIITNQVRKGMVFLLCSDGLYKYFPERKLRKYMKRVQKGKSLDESCEQLLEKTLEGEAKDNISVVMVFVNEF